MKKSNQADNLIELIAVSGELPAEAVYRIEGGVQYKEKLIAGLKSSGMIRTFYKDKLRGYRLTLKAKKKLLETAPERFEFYLTGEVETNHVQSTITRRLRLHRIAETIISMHNSGIKIFRDEKTDVFYPAEENTFIPQPLLVTFPSFYTSREFKELGSEIQKIKNARAVGTLLTEDYLFVVYNTGDAEMKWEYKTEIEAKAVLRYYLCQKRLVHLYTDEKMKGLIFGNTMEILYELFVGGEGDKRKYFFLDNAFDSFIYLTNDRYGDILLKILCDGSFQRNLNNILCENLQPPSKALTIENDALDENGNPVLCWHT